MKGVLKGKYLIIIFCFIGYNFAYSLDKKAQIVNHHSFKIFDDKPDIFLHYPEEYENEIWNRQLEALITTVVFIFIMVSILWMYLYHNNKQKILSIEQVHQKQLIDKSIETQENERKRIATDIHDGLIGELRYMQLVSDDKDQIKEIKRCVMIARNISHDLSPPFIDKISLGEMVQDYLSAYSKLYIVETKIVEMNEVHMSNAIKLSIYRIFQEVITNIKKHANCSRVCVYLKIYKGIVRLLINDDGIGIVGKNSYGLGLKNIEIRANQLNAKYKFINDKSKGTKFIFVCAII